MCIAFGRASIEVSESRTCLDLSLRTGTALQPPYDSAISSHLVSVNHCISPLVFSPTKPDLMSTNTETWPLFEDLPLQTQN